MIIKVGSRVIDAEDEPIAIFLTDVEKEQISQMGLGQNIFCSYSIDSPDSVAQTFVDEFIEQLILGLKAHGVLH